VATDLPPELREIAQFQSGVIARTQVVRAGLSADLISSRLRRGSWRRLQPGVYASSSGEPSRQAILWAAVLYAGPGAVLSQRTAAELWGLADEMSSLVHLTVPADRRVRRQPGLVVHLSARAALAAHPAATPPRTRVEETIIDLWEAAPTLDDAVSWIVRRLGRRLTTQDKLWAATEARSRLRWRAKLAEILSPDLAGLHSILEYRYVRDVERPHSLPAGNRQAHSRRDGRSEYRDTLYETFRTAVELDGRVAHPGDSRWKDIHRDNAASADGVTTLRYGWLDITGRACQVAAEIAEVLAARGYRGARPCSTGCPVALGARPSPAVRSASSSQTAHATQRLPIRRKPAQRAQPSSQRASRPQPSRPGSSRPLEKRQVPSA
jgi:hypothetical protein